MLLPSLLLLLLLSSRERPPRLDRSSSSTPRAPLRCCRWYLRLRVELDGRACRSVVLGGSSTSTASSCTGYCCPF